MDELEFRRFVSARGSALCRSAYLLTGDWQLGEDLVQTALANTWTRHRFLRSPDAVEAYVRRTMARTLISWRRRRSSRELPVQEPAEEVVADPVEGAVDRSDTHRLLAGSMVKYRRRRNRGLVASVVVAVAIAAISVVGVTTFGDHRPHRPVPIHCRPMDTRRGPAMLRELPDGSRSG